MSATNSPALIFAAGFGTRMKELTKDQPKPMIEVAGQPLIDHAVALVRDAGCDPIAANLHYCADVLAAHLRPKGVTTIEEQPDILETGGGLRNALPVLGDRPVVTLNSDAIWAGPNPVNLLQNAWQPSVMDALLMCVPLHRAVGHNGKGDFTLTETGALRRGPGVVYGGVQIIKTDLLGGIKETSFSLNVLWDMMLERDRMSGLIYPGRWCDVGHPGGIKQAEDMLDAHRV
jgi:MurNAc alpha-1-phosphate uridylyltransferase